MGGDVGSYNAVSFAFTSDLSNDKNRSRNFALLESSIFFGGGFAPVCGGFLLQHAPPWVTFAVTCCCFLCCLFVWQTCTCESVPRALRATCWPAGQHSCATLHKPVALVVENSALLFPAALFCIAYANIMAVFYVSPFYTKLSPPQGIGMQDADVGLLLSILQLSMFLSLVFLLPICSGCFPSRSSDINCVRIGLFVQAATGVCYGFAKSKAAMFAITGMAGNR